MLLATLAPCILAGTFLKSNLKCPAAAMLTYLRKVPRPSLLPKPFFGGSVGEAGPSNSEVSTPLHVHCGCRRTPVPSARRRTKSQIGNLGTSFFPCRSHGGLALVVVAVSARRALATHQAATAAVAPLDHQSHVFVHQLRNHILPSPLQHVICVEAVRGAFGVDHFRDPGGFNVREQDWL